MGKVYIDDFVGINDSAKKDVEKKCQEIGLDFVIITQMGEDIVVCDVYWQEIFKIDGAQLKNKFRP